MSCMKTCIRLALLLGPSQNETRQMWRCLAAASGALLVCILDAAQVAAEPTDSTCHKAY